MFTASKPPQPIPGVLADWPVPVSWHWIAAKQFWVLEEYFRGIAVQLPVEVIGQQIEGLPFLRLAPVRGNCRW